MTSTPSRPFRSFGLLLACWIAFRAIAIMAGDHKDVMLVTARDIVAPAPPTFAAGSRPPAAFDGNNVPVTQTTVVAVHRVRPMTASRFAVPNTIRHPPRSHISVSTISYPGSKGQQSIAAISPSPPSAANVWTIPPSAKRWSVTAWILVREDGPAVLGPGGELGGSQAGARLFYDVGGPAAITARVSRPLARAQGGEASVGIALRHGNVGLLLERRIALDSGGRNDFSATAYGGASNIRLGYGAELDGYVQAGVVGTDVFVDGAVRVEREVVTAGKTRFSAGAGAWGGAQPGTERVDIGPQVVAHVPIAKTTVRVSAEWRERVVGNAAPRSGPSLTIGIDF